MFITFEGIEGCGKTTQIKRLGKRLRAHGIPVTLTFEPGGTSIGKKIRHILLDSRNRDLSPFSELMLYMADRAQHVQEVIKPALEQGKWVLCDRFMDATVVYQGIARNQDLKLIRVLNEKAVRRFRPDMTFLLDCPVEVGLGRAFQRIRAGRNRDQDRFERERKAFHQRVRKGYLALLRQDPKRFVMIRANANREEVETEIFRHIEPFLGSRCRTLKGSARRDRA